MKAIYLVGYILCFLSLMSCSSGDKAMAQRVQQHKVGSLELLKSNEDAVKIIGGDAVFYYGDREIKKLSIGGAIADGAVSCTSWSLSKILKIHDAFAAYISEIRCEYGEFSTEMLLLPNGRFLDVYAEAYSSPKGNYIVKGDDEVDDESGVNGNSVKIYSASSFEEVASFEQSCRPLTWIADDKFRVICNRGATGNFKSYKATIFKGKGGWTLDEG